MLPEIQSKRFSLKTFSVSINFKLFVVNHIRFGIWFVIFGEKKMTLWFRKKRFWFKYRSSFFKTNMAPHPFESWASVGCTETMSPHSELSIYSSESVPVTYNYWDIPLQGMFWYFFFSYLFFIIFLFFFFNNLI